MPSLTEHDDDPQPKGGNRSMPVPAIIVVIAVIFVLLHLTGVVGAGSH
jgi:hypothetical protein